MSKKVNVQNGQKLRGFRKQNGYSQAYVGSLINRDARTVSSYELGLFNIPESVVKTLNSKFNLKLKSAKVSKPASSKTVTKKQTTKTAKTVKATKASKVTTSTYTNVIKSLEFVLSYLKGIKA